MFSPSPKALATYKRLYQKRFGRAISNDQALNEASALLLLASLLHQEIQQKQTAEKAKK